MRTRVVFNLNGTEHVLQYIIPPVATDFVGGIEYYKQYAEHDLLRAIANKIKEDIVIQWVNDPISNV